MSIQSYSRIVTIYDGMCQALSFTVTNCSILFRRDGSLYLNVHILLEVSQVALC